MRCCSPSDVSTTPRRTNDPHKELFLLGTSGHRPIFEQPEQFHELMTDRVLAATTDAP